MKTMREREDSEIEFPRDNEEYKELLTNELYGRDNKLTNNMNNISNIRSSNRKIHQAAN